ncbi:hypothetical protein JTE90_000536 [Oedothorax gibbosus]|uniref:Uncharacterized protein n=1 Tax=Oedothorax gibbosus TaxID=931172 RepID=A0AAV6VXJ9_9ARAC|nr:hypothetical protein JTE90_000536 [Oedothorax gibbosus]
MLRSCPRENHKLFQAEADDSTCLFSEDLVVEECELSPHHVAVEVPTGWSIIGENVVLLETQDLITALSCLLISGEKNTNLRNSCPFTMEFIEEAEESTFSFTDHEDNITR